MQYSTHGDVCLLELQDGLFAESHPFNVDTYALLTMMVAQVCDLKTGEFVHTLDDAHIYSNRSD